MSWQVPNINGQLSSELVNSGWTVYKQGSTQSSQGNTQAAVGEQARLSPPSFDTVDFSDSNIRDMMILTSCIITASGISPKSPSSCAVR